MSAAAFNSSCRHILSSPPLQFQRMLRKVWPELDSERVTQLFITAGGEGVGGDEDSGRLCRDKFLAWAENEEQMQHLPIFKRTLLGDAMDALDPEGLWQRS